jgi:hypothetical protein
MLLVRFTALILACSGAACARQASGPVPERSKAPAAQAPPRAAPLGATGPAPSASAAPIGSAGPPPTEPILPPGAEFVSVGRHWASLKRVCALAPLGRSLYAAHAYGALAIDGATVTRYTPGEAQPIKVAFDWNRRGQPTKGGGAGQGFLRLREIDGRLYLPDADPPYAGFGLSGKGVEGYVFVSDAQGKFARARPPKQLPPAAPTEERAGAAVLPYAYHVFDVTRFRGRIYASGGAYVRGGGAPGALFVATDDASPWQPVAYYPDPPGSHVWRLTYLETFRERLYAGVETFDAQDTTDYVSFGGNAAGQHLTSSDARPEREAVAGGASTLRWRSVDGRLYWIAGHAGGITLQQSEDGARWQQLALPPEAGWPLDLVRFRGALVVLTERRLLQLHAGKLVEVARVDATPSPFELSDTYCPAPLAVFDGELYAGGQHKGQLYRLTWPRTTDRPTNGAAAPSD